MISLSVTEEEEISGLIKRLERFNSWRRGDNTMAMPEPRQIGLDIEQSVAILKALIKAVNE